MTDGGNSFLQKVQSSYQKLHSVAVDLNATSDQIGKPIVELDSALKKLNLGISAWVTVLSETKPNGTVRHADIGYAKIDGTWGIALRHVKGDYSHPDPEEWLFNDAPRSLRLAAIGHIPDLLEKLSKEAVETTAELKKQLSTVQEVAAVVKKLAEQPFIHPRPVTTPEERSK